jgi:hypothetical protein
LTITNSKDTCLSISKIGNTVKRSTLIDNSLDVSRLVRIQAINNSGKCTDVISGIIRRDVDFRALRKIQSKSLHSQNAFNEINDYVSYTILNKPTVYFSRKDGLIYAFSNGEAERKQAWFLLRVLAPYDHVENFKRKQQKKPFWGKYKRCVQKS